MSDLSRLLGDVYGPSGSPPAPPPPPSEGDADDTLAGRLPDWADETMLDEAFADWVPGPSADAPAAEHAVVTPDLLVHQVGEEPLAAPVAVDVDQDVDRPFHYGDDDILPRRRGRRRGRRLTLRRR